MRPLRAMAMAAVLVAAWGATRVAVIEEEMARYRAASASPRAEPSRELAPRERTMPEPAPLVASREAAEGAPRPVEVAEARPVELTEARRVVPGAQRTIAAVAPTSARAAGRAEAQAAARGGLGDAGVSWTERAEAVRSPERVELASLGLPAGVGVAPVDRLAAAAFASAERGYGYLASGERRRAARAFGAAVSTAPEHPSAPRWAAERRRLARRWSLGAYSLLREGGADGLAGARPVLGGGQSGASIGFTPDPLAARPITLQARINIAHEGLAGFDAGSTQAAVGVSWRPLGTGALTLAAERLVAVGGLARDDWTVRASGGGGGRLLGLDWAAYAEAGAIGETRADLYAGAQAVAHRPWRPVGGLQLELGGGLWGGWQQGFEDVSRLDAGPSLRVSSPRVPVAAQLDYRFRLLGEAEPSSGLALTLSTQF